MTNDRAAALTANGERFLAAYREAMQREFGPGDVAYVERVTRNMVLAATAHDEVNVSDNMRKAARKCGIATTRAAIFAYLRDAGPTPVAESAPESAPEYVSAETAYGETKTIPFSIRVF